MRKNYDNEIVTLHKSGFTNKEISNQLNLDPDTIGSRLKKYGFKSNFRAPINLVSNDLALCKKCNLIKSINEFFLQRKGKSDEYRLAYCDECRAKQLKKSWIKRNDNIDKFLSNRYGELVRRAQTNNIICSITKEEFIAQYNIQNGLCFYTDHIMIYEVNTGKHKDSLSVDKILPEKGYINGNVVFCINKVNLCKNDLSLDEIKNWMPLWYERIEKFLNEPK